MRTPPLAAAVPKVVRTENRERRWVQSSEGTSAKIKIPQVKSKMPKTDKANQRLTPIPGVNHLAKPVTGLLLEPGDFLFTGRLLRFPVPECESAHPLAQSEIGCHDDEWKQQSHIRGNGLLTSQP